MSFTGEFRHTIDAKGRLIVPSRMRDALNGDVAVLVTYLDGCIAMFSKEGFERFEQQLMGLERSREESRALIRTMGSGTHDDEVDKLDGGNGFDDCVVSTGDDITVSGSL